VSCSLSCRLASGFEDGSCPLFDFPFRQQRKKIAPATTRPPIAAPTPIPAFAPVLSPIFGSAVGEVVMDDVSETDDINVAVEAPIEEDMVVSAEGTATNCCGESAWNVSEVGVPVVHPLSPQHRQALTDKSHCTYV